MYIVKVFFDDKNGYIVCPLCNCKFFWISDYISHLMSNHEEEYHNFVSYVREVPREYKGKLEETIKKKETKDQLYTRILRRIEESSE